MQTVFQKICVFKTANTTIVENDFPRQVALEALTILVCEDETYAANTLTNTTSTLHLITLGVSDWHFTRTNITDWARIRHIMKSKHTALHVGQSKSR
jgi:hypothetical protein